MVLVLEITVVCSVMGSKELFSISDVDLETHCRDLVTPLFKDRISLLYPYKFL